jgi:hypothetical protein
MTTHYQITLPTPETHPDFPLWKLGYTSKQVYDLFVPEYNTMLSIQIEQEAFSAYQLPLRISPVLEV